jgi:hypothetical protein
MPGTCVVIAKDAYEPWRELFESAALPMGVAIVQDPETAIWEGRRCAPTDLPAGLRPETSSKNG